MEKIPSHSPVSSTQHKHAFVTITKKAQTTAKRIYILLLILVMIITSVLLYSFFFKDKYSLENNLEEDEEHLYTVTEDKSLLKLEGWKAPTTYMYLTNGGDLAQGSVAGGGERLLAKGKGAITITGTQASPNGKDLAYFVWDDQSVSKAYERLTPNETLTVTPNLELHLLSLNAPFTDKVIATNIYFVRTSVYWDETGFYFSNLEKGQIKYYYYSIDSGQVKETTAPKYLFARAVSPNQDEYVEDVLVPNTTKFLTYKLNLHHKDESFIKTVYKKYTGKDDIRISFPNKETLFVSKETLTGEKQSICSIEIINKQTNKIELLEKSICPADSYYFPLSVSPEGTWFAAIYSKEVNNQKNKNSPYGYVSSLFVYDMATKTKRMLAEYEGQYTQLTWLSDSEVLLYSPHQLQNGVTRRVVFKVNLITGEAVEQMNLRDKKIISFF